jgi:hypothetical protein
LRTPASRTPWGTVAARRFAQWHPGCATILSLSLAALHIYQRRMKTASATNTTGVQEGASAFGVMPAGASAFGVMPAGASAFSVMRWPMPAGASAFGVMHWPRCAASAEGAPDPAPRVRAQGQPASRARAKGQVPVPRDRLNSCCIAYRRFSGGTDARGHIRA